MKRHKAAELHKGKLTCCKRARQEIKGTKVYNKINVINIIKYKYIIKRNRKVPQTLQITVEERKTSTQTVRNVIKEDNQRAVNLLEQREAATGGHQAVKTSDKK